MENNDQPEKKISEGSETENPEQFIKEMMEQRKLQQDALSKIMSSIDTDVRSTSAESPVEKKNLLKRIFRNRK